MNPPDKKPVQFYYSLPRAIALLLGGNAQRSESNGFEALLVGLWVYLIHYLFFYTHSLPNRWLAPLCLIITLFAVWLIWLILVYLNWLIIKFLRLFGLFKTLPNRRAQSILWGILTTIMAGDLLLSHPWLWQLAMIWLLVVVLNLVAAMVLSYSDAARGFDE